MEVKSQAKLPNSAFAGQKHAINFFQYIESGPKCGRKAGRYATGTAVVNT